MGSSCLEWSVFAMESNNKIHGVSIVDPKLPPRWQNIKTLQWPLQKKNIFTSLHAIKDIRMIRGCICVLYCNLIGFQCIVFQLLIRSHYSKSHTYFENTNPETLKDNLLKNCVPNHNGENQVFSRKYVLLLDPIQHSLFVWIIQVQQIP